ncbi:MAG TPA: Asp-tRNA(Asn)/Glu-tRNA(Gln) amidotransferase subunit GatB [Verrucomicrobiales bacterium]|nr:Asp-tRNA(Asn)/Glu-tRNA(Gln) amidotransferase subunit GatB [Verrucomicrobiales bacterium]HIL72346.1 Asp-tRNA(Asn)/Glu-tRNA(Gln) amidotransferase subunit GatB [Verrucomicrobiota bacterium]
MEYEIVIGLETHVQLKTRSKMWCGCVNQFGGEPNTHVCPVCLGFPGVLPVANEEALRLTVLTGMLLNCGLPKRAKFDRKNYFYPDASKNYQITQYDLPSTLKGCVEFESENKTCRVGITRAHLEEDVGKSSHFDRVSGVDFNRAGVPLLEIVSEPEITSVQMASDYLNELKTILIYGGISDCDMEKGMVRCDLNLSTRPVGQKELGKKVEIKNMNSFSGARKALTYEMNRQIKVLRNGGALIQETRRWDDAEGMTHSMRSKEMAHDYRYLPEPDLMPFEPETAWYDSIRESVVELPLARKRRYMKDYGLPPKDTETLVSNPSLAGYFEKAAEHSKKPKAVANLILNNLRACMSESNHSVDDLKIQPTHIHELVQLVDSGKINSRIAQEVFNAVYESGKSPQGIVEEKGLAQVSDSSTIDAFCDEVIKANPKSVEDFQAGKQNALNFLKGQVMRLSKGKANPALVGQVLEKRILNP